MKSRRRQILKEGSAVGRGGKDTVLQDVGPEVRVGNSRG